MKFISLGHQLFKNSVHFKGVFNYSSKSEG